MVAPDRTDIRGECTRVLYLVPPFIDEFLNPFVKSPVKRERSRTWLKESAFVGGNIDGPRYVVNTQLIHGGMLDVIIARLVCRCRIPQDSAGGWQ